MAPGEVLRVRAAVGDAHHLEIRLGPEPYRQRVREDLMVVDDEDAHGADGGSDQLLGHRGRPPCTDSSGTGILRASVTAANGRTA